MILVSIYKDKEMPNERFTRVLTDEQYATQREYLLGHYTVEVRNEDG